MSKKNHIHPAAPLAISEAFRLTDADLAAIDRRVQYTLSPENKARNVLIRRVGLDAAARAESYLGNSVSGEARGERYLDLVRAFDSKVFLQDSKAGAVDAGGARLRDTAAAAESGQTPTSNTGVTEETTNRSDWQNAEPLRLVIGSGKHAKVLEVPQRRGHNGAAAFPDWVHVTIGKETCDQYADFLGSDEDRVLILSYRLERIFGFGVTIKHTNGRNFYKASYGMGNDKESWGYVCIGGQEETILIGLTGTGLTAAKPGWERRLVDWLEGEVERPKLTRVDLAYDDYEGKYSVDDVEREYYAGGFQCYHGTEPVAERIGTDWIQLEKQARAEAQALQDEAVGVVSDKPVKVREFRRRGRTFAVGRRASGKYFRGYEKGRQLGAVDSLWLRFEVEFKTAGEKFLPFDMLLEPGKYLAGAYPCLAWICETQNHLATHKKQLEITLQSSIEFVNKQAGQHINVLVEALGMDGFLQKVRREGIPKRFKVADLETAPNPIRISDRLEGLDSKELNALLDLHIAGHAVPGAFYGHRSESTSFRPN